MLRLLLTVVAIGWGVWLSADEKPVPATILWYVEQEPGIDPYRVRYIVTDDYLRSDDGRDDGDFLLFDRSQDMIYSVVPESRTSLELDGNGVVPEAPAEIGLRIKQSVDDNAPKIGGRSPLALQLFAGGELCHSAMVAPGFLDNERQVFQALSRALAVQQTRTLNNTPVELRTGCFLAYYLHAGDFHLRSGMVLAEWGPDGKRRELVGVEDDVMVSPALFIVPDDYAVMRADGS